MSFVISDRIVSQGTEWSKNPPHFPTFVKACQMKKHVDAMNRSVTWRVEPKARVANVHTPPCIV